MTDGMFLALAILVPLVTIAIIVPWEVSKYGGGLARMGLRSQFVPLPGGLWFAMILFAVIAAILGFLAWGIALGWIPEAQWIQAKYGPTDIWK